MESLVQFLLSFFRGLRFFRIVNPDERGIRLFCGRVTGVLNRGLRPVWPVVGDIMIMQVSIVTADLRLQSLTTSDGKSVGSSWMVNYRVIDPVKAAYETANHDTQLETEASAVISEAVMARTWDQCLNERRQLQEEVHRTLTREMHRFGVEILKTSLNDLTYQRVIRLVQNREAYDAYEEG